MTNAIGPRTVGRIGPHQHLPVPIRYTCDASNLSSCSQLTDLTAVVSTAVVGIALVSIGVVSQAR